MDVAMILLCDGRKVFANPARGGLLYYRAGRRQSRGEHFGCMSTATWCCSRAPAELMDDGIESRLGIPSEVRAIGKTTAEQPVGALAGRTLPQAVQDTVIA